MAPLLIIAGAVTAVIGAIIIGKIVKEKEKEKKDKQDNIVNCGYRKEDIYILCQSQINSFHTSGLAILPNMLSNEEILTIETIYDQYMRDGSPEKQGKDFCDMSKPFDTPRENYSVINAMLPRIYYPELQGNIYERVTASIAKQLFPDTPMQLDYDQLLDKNPGASDAVFAWHQDMAYWPNTEMTPDTRTVTFSLALDSTNQQNGCIRYIPGSGVKKELRPHLPLGNSREEAHAVAALVGDEEIIEYAEVSRGSASIHDEYVVHGSGGNLSDGKRRTYVIAYRTAETVTRERAAGFTHSHNDQVNWDLFNGWQNSEKEKVGGSYA